MSAVWKEWFASKRKRIGNLFCFQSNHSHFTSKTSWLILSNNLRTFSGLLVTIILQNLYKGYWTIRVVYFPLANTEKADFDDLIPLIWERMHNSFKLELYKLLYSKCLSCCCHSWPDDPQFCLTVTARAQERCKSDGKTLAPTNNSLKRYDGILQNESPLPQQLLCSTWPGMSDGSWACRSRVANHSDNTSHFVSHQLTFTATVLSCLWVKVLATFDLCFLHCVSA